MMFSARPINLDCSAIDDESGRTVAYVTPQGWVDWLLRDPDQPGEHLEAIEKETHLGNVRGLKFNLNMQHPPTAIFRNIDIATPDSGSGVVISARSESVDGALRAECRATLGVSPDTGRYEWNVVTRLENISPAPLNLPWVEYNNMLPADTGGRFLCERRKKFDRFLIEDADQVIWEYPHQHVLDYRRIVSTNEKLPFPIPGAEGCWGGFFGEAFNPIVTMNVCDGEPCWAICDAYFDFHCCSRHNQPLSPGAAWSWDHRIHWLDADQSAPLLKRARRRPVSETEWRKRSGARMGLGFNDFRKSVQLDGADEGSAFIPDGINRFWDKSGGPDDNGVVRMVASNPGELVWPAAVIDPTQMPAASRLNIRGKMQVTGKCRMSFRLKPHVYEWRPKPHVDWLPDVCSAPVGDTADRWVDFAVPEFRTPALEPATELAIELVLAGPGTGSMSCLEVILEDA